MSFLADFILNAPPIWTKADPSAEMIKADLRGAQKFVLDETISVAADSIEDGKIAGALQFCRTPYPLTWIEVAQTHRPGFVNGIKTDRRTESTPSRVGVLIESTDPNGARFNVNLFWMFKEAHGVFMGNLVALVPHRTLHQIHFDALSEDPMQCQAGPSKYCADPVVMKLLASRITSGLFDPLSDWHGEMSYWMGVLGLLNCRNAVNVQAANLEKLNRSRLRSGKTPLVDHHVCTIRLSGQKAHTIEGGQHSRVRSHFVRGHFKTRKTGIYWWSPFVRGYLAKGFASKDYRVKAA